MQNKYNKNQGLQNNPYINQQGQGMPNNMQANTQNAQQNPYYNNQQTLGQQPSSMDSLLGSFDTSNFLKGALIGAVGAYLLTNENAQKTIFKTFAKSADMFGAGIEELKERMEDAKAELEAQKEEQ